MNQSDLRGCLVFIVSLSAWALAWAVFICLYDRGLRS